MKRRDFIKTSTGVVISTGLILSSVECGSEKSSDRFVGRGQSCSTSELCMHRGSNEDSDITHEQGLKEIQMRINPEYRQNELKS